MERKQSGNSSGDVGGQEKSLRLIGLVYAVHPPPSCLGLEGAGFGRVRSD
jgi:hypothetical protein